MAIADRRTDSSKVDESTKTDNAPKVEDENAEYIVHRQNFVNPETGQPEQKEHRVLLKDWPAYEKEHNL